MKKILVLFAFFSITIFCQSGWHLVADSSYSKFIGVHFEDPLNGWLLTEFALLQTSNRGIDWQTNKIFSYGNYGNCTDLEIIDSTFWVKNGYGPDAIFKTTDFGSSWSSFPTYVNLSNFDFFDNEYGWGYSYYPSGEIKILRTTDSGENWTEQYSDEIPYYTQTIYDIEAITKDTCIAAGYFGNIFRTTDGGNIWQVDKIADGTLFSIHFLNNKFGWVCGYLGEIYKTTDTGLTWFKQESGTQSNLHSIYFVDENCGWAGGRAGTIINTTNGGISWYEQNSNTEEVINDIYFVDSKNGYFISGDRYHSSLFATKNGGITSVETENQAPKNFELGQNYPNPFNPSTIIKFTIPYVGISRELSLQTKLFVYNALGQQVAVLVNENKQSGVYEVEFDGSNLSSGIYYYKLVAGDYILVKKMILLK